MNHHILRIIERGLYAAGITIVADFSLSYLSGESIPSWGVYIMFLLTYNNLEWKRP